jgi:hypothetical protein
MPASEPKTPKLAEIAARITAHLKRFEADPKVNARDSDVPKYWQSHAWSTGRYVKLDYYLYRRTHRLIKSQALAYLEWLDAGGVGKHYGHTGESK